MTEFFRQHRGFLILALLFLLLGLLRLNDLSLYTDSTRYIIWGTSIAQGKGWIDNTQPEPERYVVNAPLYSVVLAPAMIVSPMSLTAAKVWTLLWGCLALMLFGVWLRRTFGETIALVGLFFLAVNPMMLVISSEALSEAPFLAVFMVVLLVIDHLLQENNRKSFWLLLACLSIVALLREVAVALVAAVVLTLLLRKKWKEAAVIVVGAAALLGVWMFRNLVLVGEPPTSQSSNIHFIFEHVVTPPDASTVFELVTRVRLNLVGFGVQMAGMLFYSLPSTLIISPSPVFKFIVNGMAMLKYAVFVITVPLMVLGALRDWQQSPSAPVRLLFVLGYLAIILTYPIHDVRFLLPVLPLMIFYLLAGVRWIREHFLASVTIRSGWIAATAIVVMIPNYFCIYEVLKTNLAYNRSPEEFHRQVEATGSQQLYFSEPWQLMGDWISKNLPDSVVIGCGAKEVMGFLGHRKILEINDGVPLPIFEQLLRDNGARYLLAIGVWDNVTTYEFPMRESRRFWFEPVKDIAGLHLFRIHSRWLTPPSRRPGWTFEYDTTSTAGLLRKGRLEILQDRFAQAESTFARALGRGTPYPLLMFQQIVAASFATDSITVGHVQKTMFNIPRSTAYIWATRLHIQAMNALIDAERIQEPSQRAEAVYNVARLTWNLGYNRRGYELMREVARTDSNNFVGLLWAWHYAIQVGDSSHARQYLNRLATIDNGNAVVRSFEEMTRLAQVLRSTPSATMRSDIHVLIAEQYKKMELPEDALDETERALSEDSTNATAWSLYSDLFKQKKKPLAMQLALRHESPR